MFTKADQQGLWLLKTEVLDTKQSRHKWEIHKRHGFMSFEARRHHYDPLIWPPAQSRPKRRKCNQICVNLNLEHSSGQQWQDFTSIHVTLGNNKLIFFLSSSKSAAFPSSHTLPKALLIPQYNGRNVPSWARLSGSIWVLLEPPATMPTGRGTPLKLQWQTVLPHTPGMPHTFLPWCCCAIPPAVP